MPGKRKRSAGKTILLMLYVLLFLSGIQQQHTWGVASCSASLIAQLGRIFQEQDQKQNQRQRPRMDRKHRREIEEKKQAMGIRD